MRNLIILVTLLLTVSCSPKQEPNLEINADLAAVVSLAVDKTMIQDRNGKAYLPNNTEPFSGWAKCDHDNEQVHLMMRFTEGYLTRVARWQSNGIINFDLVFDSHDGTELADIVEELLGAGADYFDDYSEVGFNPIEFNCITAHFTWWHENGRKAVSQNWKNDKLEGEVSSYYQNGQLASLEIYREGLIIEVKERFLINGDKCGKTLLSNGTGLCMYYDLDHGSLQFESPFVDGKPHGIEKGYHEDGSLLSEWPYVDGKQHGIVKVYNEDGSLWIEAPYVDGERHGTKKSYNEDGTLSEETPYVDGKQHGVEKTYNDDGSLRTETPYVNGERHGVQKTYNDDGSLWYETHYVDGVRQY